ncbi:hypothetical protein BD413DRAFT_608645 [Trametes elegans]|nr:hypothetical protein BD413DRAFT_608645 [Trametes elegans]
MAHALALAKARMLLLPRMEENESKTVATVKGEDPHANVKFVECDLGNLDVIKDVAERIRESKDRLDLIIADAGVGVDAFALTASGIDRHFGLNHLGHFLLINRPLLRKTAALLDTPAPRIPPRPGCIAPRRTRPEVEENGWNGKCFTEAGKLSEESKQAQDPELGKNLWELSAKLITTKLGLDGLLSWDPPESYARL